MAISPLILVRFGQDHLENDKWTMGYKICLKGFWTWPSIYSQRFDNMLIWLKNHKKKNLFTGMTASALIVVRSPQNQRQNDLWALGYNMGISIFGFLASSLQTGAIICLFTSRVASRLVAPPTFWRCGRKENFLLNIFQLVSCQSDQ